MLQYPNQAVDDRELSLRLADFFRQQRTRAAEADKGELARIDTALCREVGKLGIHSRNGH